jgi:hypothetical protein
MIASLQQRKEQTFSFKKPTTMKKLTTADVQSINGGGIQPN